MSGHNIQQTIQSPYPAHNVWPCNELHPIPFSHIQQPLIPTAKLWHKYSSDGNHSSLTFLECPTQMSSWTPSKMSSEKGERWTSWSPTAPQLKCQNESMTFCELYASMTGSQNHTTNTRTLQNIGGNEQRTNYNGTWTGEMSTQTVGYYAYNG